MISFVTIENFRALNRIELNDLKRVNLISGRNNIGKSTLLEALFLYMDHSSSDSFGKLNSFRGTIGTGVEGLWEPLFHQMNPDVPICISVVDGADGPALCSDRLVCREISECFLGTC